MGLKFQNPKFNILYKITDVFLYEMPTHWRSQVNEAIPEQLKVAEYASILYASKFHIKIYLESFLSIYPLYYLFTIIYKSIFYNLDVTLINN